MDLVSERLPIRYRVMSNAEPEKRDGGLYPDFIPHEPGHPTTARVEVVCIDETQGRGLRALVNIRAGGRVATLSGILVNHTTLDTIQLSSNWHFADPWFCRFLLHCCDPNTRLDIDLLEARAIRDIWPGDCVTIDYSATEDTVARQFPCHCGSRNCRLWITGRKEKPNREGRAFLAG
jgi:hypothetical protein